MRRGCSAGAGKTSVKRAKAIVEDEDDFGDDGSLKENVKDDYEEKYGDLNYMSDYLSDGDSYKNTGGEED